MLSVLMMVAVLSVMVFFSLIIAPMLFSTLSTTYAGAFVRKFFPRYYLILGLLSLLTGLIATDATIAGIGFVCAALFLLSLLMTPAINRASDRHDKRHFALLHGGSVLISLLQMGLLLWGILRLSW